MFDFLVWVLLAGVAVILGIFLPGYLILRIFPFTTRLDPGDVAIFSFGIGLIALPLSIYWANVLGVAINLQGVFIVIAILVLTMLACNALLLILKRKQFIQSRQDQVSNDKDQALRLTRFMHQVSKGSCFDFLSLGRGLTFSLFQWPRLRNLVSGSVRRKWL